MGSAELCCSGGEKSIKHCHLVARLPALCSMLHTVFYICSPGPEAHSASTVFLKPGQEEHGPRLEVEVASKARKAEQAAHEFHNIYKTLYTDTDEGCLGAEELENNIGSRVSKKHENITIWRNKLIQTASVDLF